MLASVVFFGYSRTQAFLSCLQSLPCTVNSTLYAIYSQQLAFAKADYSLCTAEARKGKRSLHVLVSKLIHTQSRIGQF
jgi:hypothetical protein